jgi:Fe-S-cluster-containing dehydrogenase component
MNRYSMIIDDEACWGCRACEVACKQEMSAPDGVKLISVREQGPELKEGKWSFLFQVNVCNHCETPPCAEACVDAVITRRQDGIVVLDQERCTGCGACAQACPYDAIAFDSARSVAAKCNLCAHRIDRGLLPACADNICLAHCIRLETVA